MYGGSYNICHNLLKVNEGGSLSVSSNLPTYPTHSSVPLRTKPGDRLVDGCQHQDMGY